MTKADMSYKTMKMKDLMPEPFEMKTKKKEVGNSQWRVSNHTQVFKQNLHQT